MSQDLFDAIDAGDIERVRALVQAEPSLASAWNEAGLSAVRAATYRHRPDIAGALLDAGPELDVFDAAAVGDVDRLAALLDGRPSLASEFATDGFMPLGLAAYFARPAAVELLLARGADLSARARNAMAVQPLHAAVAGRSVESVRMLLAAGADPNARQHGGWTPLQAAAAHGDGEIVDLLLDAGADLEAANDAGATAASLAAGHGHEELAARLSAKRSTTS